jgi:phosphate transport system permease protein
MTAPMKATALNSSKHPMYKRRALKDRIARHFVAIGGVSVIVAILLIFFYLLYSVIPMFERAEVHLQNQYTMPGEGNTVHVGIEELGTVSVRITDKADVVFFDSATGEIISHQQLSTPPITTVATNNDQVLFGFEDGTALAIRYKFEASYANDIRKLTPVIEYPLGEEPLTIDEQGRALRQISFNITEDSAGIAVVTDDNRLLFNRFTREKSFLDDSVSTELESRASAQLKSLPMSIELTPNLNYIYVAKKGTTLLQFDLGYDDFKGDPETIRLPHNITSIRLLLGGASLLIGMDNGDLQQWMQVRKTAADGSEYRELTYIRDFESQGSPVQEIRSEQRRKGFVVGNDQGNITIYYATSQRTLATFQDSDMPIVDLAWSARAQHLLAVDADEQVYIYEVDNEYPEVSWDVIWGKVWYEGYDEPDYIWQSSASTNDFEPKLSLVPLSFGTIKAAIYAMLFAIPIAILGAIYTAQFMAPRMRQTVKPSIEIMEALPTVILGFLAGLWLAPVVEEQLAGIFTLLLILPFGFIICAWLYRYVPARFNIEGWEGLLLVPVVLFMIWFAMSISHPIEELFFNGDLRHYMTEQWGIGYDQRNSLVVGLIMGFAVIPTIFSIAEDALFSVPQHLIRGSLALGATRWQTLMRVILPAASPAIFSALMMGFGRAVGETMIVLMATGNTPVMDMSIFEGMRTLSANIAVEVPEAEVGSTHYRVLFLAAFVLFMFTFVFNTMAEVIRQRLRQRYSAL